MGGKKNSGAAEVLARPPSSDGFGDRGADVAGEERFGVAGTKDVDNRCVRGVEGAGVLARWRAENLPGGAAPAETVTALT